MRLEWNLINWMLYFSTITQWPIFCLGSLVHKEHFQLLQWVKCAFSLTAPVPNRHIVNYFCLWNASAVQCVKWSSFQWACLQKVIILEASVAETLARWYRWFHISPVPCEWRCHFILLHCGGGTADRSNLSNCRHVSNEQVLMGEWLEEGEEEFLLPLMLELRFLWLTAWCVFICLFSLLLLSNKWLPHYRSQGLTVGCCFCVFYSSCAPVMSSCLWLQ